MNGLRWQAVEGVYPHPRHDYLLATWSDYNALLG